jgi:hypothetical protein
VKVELGCLSEVWAGHGWDHGPVSPAGPGVHLEAEVGVVLIKGAKPALVVHVAEANPVNIPGTAAAVTASGAGNTSFVWSWKASFLNDRGGCLTEYGCGRSWPDHGLVMAEKMPGDSAGG